MPRKVPLRKRHLGRSKDRLIKPDKLVDNE